MTLIYISIQDTNGDGSTVVQVGETFDTVIEKIFPTSQATAALEERERYTFHMAEGHRTMIHPANIYRVDEE